MKRFYFSLSLALILPISSALAQEDAQQPRPRGDSPRGDNQPGEDRCDDRRQDRRGDGLIARMVHLMPPAFAEHLDLDAQQQKTISGLETEFRKKRQEILIQTGFKVFNIIDNLGEAEEEREPAPVLAIAHEVTGGLLQSRRLRFSFEKKVFAVLSPEQKEEFIDLKEQPVLRREARGEDDFLKPLSRRLERSLDLTDEQRKQFAQMHEQWQTQFRNLLTQEQRQRWDRMTRTRRAPAIRAED